MWHRSPPLKPLLLARHFQIHELQTMAFKSESDSTSAKPTDPPYEIVDFAQIQPTPCPCGQARRAFADVADWPMTLHVTEIKKDAELHYHRTLTETYYFLECEPDAKMQLNDEIIPVKPGMSVMIRPQTRHRAIGKMRVLIVVHPKFDPQDEVVVEDPSSS